MYKSVIYTSDKLQGMKAVDESPRVIKAKDIVLFRCKCGTEGSKKFSDAQKSNKLYGFYFQCKTCGLENNRNKVKNNTLWLERIRASAQTEVKKATARANGKKRLVLKKIGNVRDYWNFSDADIQKIAGHESVTATCRDCGQKHTKPLKKYIEASNAERSGCSACWSEFTNSESYSLLMSSRSAPAGSDPRKRQSEALVDFWKNATEKQIADQIRHGLESWVKMPQEDKDKHLLRLRNGYDNWVNSMSEKEWQEFTRNNNRWTNYTDKDLTAAKDKAAEQIKQRWLALTFEEQQDRVLLMQIGQEEWVTANPNLAFSSVAEREIKDWIQDELKLDCRKFRSGGKEVDVLIDDKNIAIEHNGLYYHSEIFKTKGYHLEKTLYYKTLGVRVIHIFEDKWKHRKKQVKSYLRSALGMNKNIVGANKCEVRHVPKKEAIEFLDNYHIQGGTQTINMSLGLYYKEQLIALASFGPHHRGLNEAVLKRFAGKEDWSVMGGLSRLSKAAVKELNRSIITWADLSLSDGSGYEKSGWVLEEISDPDYFYTDMSRVFSKQSRKKQAVDTPKDMTEHTHALLDGLFRVYDCGKARYRFDPTSC